MFPKIKINKKGFTLVEMIIVVAIIAIVSAGVVFSGYGMRAQREFENEYNKVIAIIQQARSMALSGQSYPDFADYSGDGDFDNLILPHGYIVKIYAEEKEAGSGEETIFVELWADLYGTKLEEIDEDDILINRIELQRITGFDFTPVRNGENREKEPPDSITLLYKTMDAKFSLPQYLPTTSVEFIFIGEEGRTRYVYLHHLTGIPEPSRESRLQEDGSE